MPISSIHLNTDPANHADRPAAAPLVIELDGGLSPLQVAKRLRHLPNLLVMESAMRHPTLGRYSFVTADPVEWFAADPNHLATTFDWLDLKLTEFRTRRLNGLPPFQGGIAGLFDYEFNRSVEPILANNRPLKKSPAMLGVYDVVVAWDHEENRAWLISHGMTSSENVDSKQLAQNEKAAERAKSFLDLINDATRDETVQDTEFVKESAETDFASDFTRQKYLAMIERAIEYIRAGDIFQVNLAQHLTHPATCESLELYERLRKCNAATFSNYLDLGTRQIISASPERLIAVKDGHVETRPIKGTRRRTMHPEVDINVGRELLQSGKDRAENVMIVDLMRNDLSHVCSDDSVKVTQFVELEEYASVLHLVSAVEGDLMENVKPSDLLRAVFPGGSITGAPKIRAMQVIDELETQARGAYCGSLGYFGFDGSIDLNILIRTISAENQQWHFPVGGGITINSDAESEYDETWTKAKGMLDAMGQGRSNR